MSSPSPPAPDISTSQLAQTIPGFNPAPAIAAGNNQLADNLAMPTQHILDQLGLHRLADPALGAPLHPAAPANPGGALNALNPTQLISPVINALSTTLGTGQFSGTDPTSMLNGISNAFATTSGSVQQALGSVEQGWQGASSAAAGAKTAAAVANGTQIAAQADGLRTSLAAAVADVAQARATLIEIVNEFLATLAAIGPNIIFPWGWAAVIAAAAKAVTHTTQVMTELQSSLAAQASAVTAIGSPIAVTSAPQGAASMTGPLNSLLGMGSTGSATSSASGLSTFSPLISAATSGLSSAMSAASAAGRAGSLPGASGAPSSVLAGAGAADPKAAAGDGASAHKSGAAGLAAGAGGGPGAAPVSRVSAPVTPAAPETTTTAMPAGAARPAASSVPVGGGGMMGAPLAGAGHGAGAGGAHTAASFLQTADHGGKVVGGRNTVAPPVIGEVDPYDTPDVELRI
jgi:hypothetical protein